MHLTDIGTAVWQSKYRHARDGAGEEPDIGASIERIARAVARGEAEPDRWAAAFGDILDNFLFLPGGRVWAGAGTGRQVTLFNCFVGGTIGDSLESIAGALGESAVTMQQGGGIGLDFSTLRPAGSAARRTGGIASGPVSFMEIWDAMCRTLLSTSTRRGAMMATLRCDHPDIESFIDAKRDPGSLGNFNLSVLITDAFMQSVAEGGDWTLQFPPSADPAAGGDASRAPQDAAITYGRRVAAASLWRRIAEAARETAEPGVLFLDRINRENNLYYCESISATNPCGEIPLPPYGACDLGSVNLTACITQPFTDAQAFDWRKLDRTVETAVRFLDNVVDVSRFPLDRQAARARATRRIGLGITGLADALVMLGLHYDSDAARQFAARVMTRIRDAAYTASAGLAGEKGEFPLYDRRRFGEAPFVRRLPQDLQSGIAASGIRNSHLLAIAPAGSISLLAGNISSGIEPIYALESERRVFGADREPRQIVAVDYALARWRSRHGRDSDPPGVFVTADQLPARAHLEMQAVLQPLVDNAISKTVNVPADTTADGVQEIYTSAYDLGMKGCTVFRPGTVRGRLICPA